MTHKNRLIAVLFILLLAGAVVFCMFGLHTSEDAAAHTLISGIKPSSVVQVEVIEYVRGESAEPERVNRHFTVHSDEHGQVVLLPLQQNFDTYQITFTANDNSVKTLVYDTAHNEGLLRVQGTGFQENELFEVHKSHEKYTSRTDWTGALSRDIGVNANDFDKQKTLRFSFFGQLAPDEAADYKTDQNPNIINVVVAVGGGPSSADVNVYNPPIGTCATVDNTTIFETSTCDVNRMNDHIVPQPADAPGTIETNYVAALMLMTEQFSAIMMQQMLIIGQFFDAKEQQEAQRDYRRLVAQAHKDYHPSTSMCQYGTFTRSLAHTEESSALNSKAFNQVLLAHYRQMSGMGSESEATELASRIDQFKNVYCDPNDFNGALWLMCRGEHHDADDVPSSGTAAQRNRFNNDIEYYRTVGQDLTLEVNYNDGDLTNKEQDIVALAKNLYWPVVYETGMLEKYGPDDEDTAIYDAQEEFTATRSIIAKASVAHNSLAAIVGMKSATIEPGEWHASTYMKSLMRDFILSDSDIHEFLGDNPSYYAQMEMLTKLMYQHPNFYTNLYDKPANVDRMNASMQAIQLMQSRDRQESQLRQEMLISQLVEQGLRKHAIETNQKILDLARDYYPPESTGYNGVQPPPP